MQTVDRATRSRRTSLSALSVLIALACFAVGWMSPSDSFAQLQGWKLTWQDEFDGPVVDGRKWNMINKKNSDNNEKQYYVPEQASIVDGNLRITATNQPLDGKLYRSARLESKHVSASADSKRGSIFPPRKACGRRSG